MSALKRLHTEGECLQGFSNFMESAKHLDLRLLAYILYQWENMGGCNADPGFLVNVIARALQEHASDEGKKFSVLQRELDAVIELQRALNAKALAIRRRLEQKMPDKVQPGHWKVSMDGATPIEEYEKNDAPKNGLSICDLDISPTPATAVA